LAGALIPGTGGTADPGHYGIHIPTNIDVKTIRVKLDMMQEEFAASFGFSINTLRHWEQGRRVPEGPTRAHLLVINHDPEAVQRGSESGMTNQRALSSIGLPHDGALVSGT
jgi:putative transcriptional regulator